MSTTPNVSEDPHRPNVALYVKVFAALMVLTMITVIISKIHLPPAQAIGLGMFVALVKASLVGALFMHLWGENKLIHQALWTTLACGAVLIIPLIDCVLVLHLATSPMAVADQHPPHHEAGHESPEPIELDAHQQPMKQPEKKKAGH